MYDCIYWQGWQTAEVHMSREARERLTQWIVSQRIDDYLYGSRAAHRSASRSCVFNASAVLSGWFHSTCTLCVAPAGRHSAKRGDTYGARRCRVIRCGDYAAIFAWTGRWADGSMLWKIGNLAQHHNNRGTVRTFPQFSRHFCSSYNAKAYWQNACVLAILKTSSDERRPPPSTP